MSLRLKNNQNGLAVSNARSVPKKGEKEESISITGPPTAALDLSKVLQLDENQLTETLWATDWEIHKILLSSPTLFEARNRLFRHLNALERAYFNIYSDKKFKYFHDLEKKHAKWCIRVLKNIIRTENEKLAGTSALNKLWKLAHLRPKQVVEVNKGFLCEFIFLFSGINGNLPFYQHGKLLYTLEKTGEKEGKLRSRHLDKYAEKVNSYLKRYPCGLEPDIIGKRSPLTRKIMDYFQADQENWNDYRWQLEHIISDLFTLEQLVELTSGEREGLEAAQKHGVPFQITPYYLSLFDPQSGSGRDTAVRVQVLPNKQYVESLVQALKSGSDLDFMGEAVTSPINGITRRYAQVVILKAFDSCPQICVYCQRNWEIQGLSVSRVDRKRVEKAIDWIAANKHIEEMLVTGGDPLTLGDDYLKWMLDKLAGIEHLERIRISTRTPVTLPCRITPELVELLRSYHDLGRREVCIVTHFESGLEMTPEALQAVKRLRAASLNVYNQQVFTYFNSRRFETSALRKLLKRCGVDPYYCFNTKGKEETKAYRVPIARLLQEWTEEARLLPGMVRTDTPVFNVPTLEKNYLQSWQDHEIIMILPDGCRVYRFYPWESMLSLAFPYLYTDVSVYGYLKRLQKDGENVNDYNSIWYYF